MVSFQPTTEVVLRARDRCAFPEKCCPALSCTPRSEVRSSRGGSFLKLSGGILTRFYSTLVFHSSPCAFGGIGKSAPLRSFNWVWHFGFVSLGCRVLHLACLQPNLCTVCHVQCFGPKQVKGQVWSPHWPGLLEGYVGPACLAWSQIRGGNWGFFLYPLPNFRKVVVSARQ